VKKAFRDAYNAELELLREQASDFAREFPDIAEDLGGLVGDNMDPSIKGLFEGVAFLSARVQLKIDEEFQVFTRGLLEQVFPEALQPTPATLMLQARVPLTNSAIAEGLRFERHAPIEFALPDAKRRVRCRFRLAAPLTIWPLRLAELTYHPLPASVVALRGDVAPGTRAGLSFTLERCDGAEGETFPLADLGIDTLPVHFTGSMQRAVALYEQVFSRMTRISLTWRDAHGDPVHRTLPDAAVEQIGFDDGDALLPRAAATFAGFALLREAFVLPRKFLGFRIAGLREHLSGIETDRVTVVIEVSEPDERLATYLETGDLSLFCVPAVNLFEEPSASVDCDRKRTEHLLTAASAPATHYEVVAISSVYGRYRKTTSRQPVLPLYAAGGGMAGPRKSLYYTSRLQPRRKTADELRYPDENRKKYLGTECFITLYDPDESPAEDADRLHLQATTLCSNRHLPLDLPIRRPEAAGDFRMIDDQTVTLDAVGRPTEPRMPLVDIDAESERPTLRSGEACWRLISYLSLSMHGLVSEHGALGAAEDGPAGGAPGRGGAALREMLSLFAAQGDNPTREQIAGIVDVSTRPMVQTLRRRDGFLTARGLEVTITLDESRFEGSGAVLLGAILDRFIAEYAAVNTFTQCVIVSQQRGREIKRWPPRSGSGPLL